MDRPQSQQPPKLRILGIDPGSRFLGWGVIEDSGQGGFPGRIHCVASGVLKLAAIDDFSERLLELFNRLEAVIREHSVQYLAIEKAFFAKDPLAALKLGQVRGVVLLLAAQHRVEPVEIAPNAVKKSVAGYGHADKDAVGKMVTRWLGGNQVFERSDESDAVAIALAVWMGLGPKRQQPRPSSTLQSPSLPSKHPLDPEMGS